MFQGISAERKVKGYLRLQDVFEEFCKNARAALPEGNALGSRLDEEAGITKGMNVLGHRCRLRFAIRESDSLYNGLAVFERELAPDTWKEYWSLEFDSQKNARPAGAPHFMWTTEPHSVAQQHLPDMVSSFLDSICSAKPSAT